MRSLLAYAFKNKATASSGNSLSEARSLLPVSPVPLPALSQALPPRSHHRPAKGLIKPDRMSRSLSRGSKCPSLCSRAEAAAASSPVPPMPGPGGLWCEGWRRVSRDPSAPRLGPGAYPVGLKAVYSTSGSTFCINLQPAQGGTDTGSGVSSF